MKKITNFLRKFEGGGDNFFSSMCAPNLISKPPINEQYLCQILLQSDERFSSYRETTEN